MEQIIHIIPLGYETDRATKPFTAETGFRANKVYVLSTIQPNGTPFEVVKKHRMYVEKVKSTFESLDIEVVLINLNTIDLLEVITKISFIVRKESLEGNIVYVNMSSAGRLTSVGATLAGMVHGARVYYVESDDYSKTEEEWNDHGMTIVNEVRIRYLENFKINLPDELQLKILVEIYIRKEMSTLDIMQHAYESSYDGFEKNYLDLNRSEKTAMIMKINRKALDDLNMMGYIEKKKSGRENIFIITNSGKYVASISGYLENKTD